jgi:hypothetical protein
MHNVKAAIISGLVAAALLVGGVVAAATQASRASDDGATRPAASSAEAADPPGWARAHKNHAARPGHADKAWKEAWHAMTPAQRERRMTELGRAHRQGMRQWAECVAAAGDDKAQRSECEKPLPPGLAKKR